MSETNNIAEEKSKNEISVGLDVGSTTAKIVVLKDGKTVYRKYERHMARIREKTLELLNGASELLGNSEFAVSMSGSAALGLSEAAGIPFVQEVFAEGEVIKALEPDTSVIIELGGEDAKIIFLEGGTDERMNGSCAGGTGAFIDQMATLLNVTADELDELSMGHSRIYPIASRCGVFAKTDIQPLINQGARKEDIAASIYQAVVNQTIAGLARGRKIDGKVLFLGGPLYFCKGLRERFRETLKLDDKHAVFPEYGQFSVALGAALYAGKSGLSLTKEELAKRLKNANIRTVSEDRLPPLFESEKDYREFCDRHAAASVKKIDPESYNGNAYLGIDCGSTTTKLALISADNRLLYTYYSANNGNPVEIVKEQLLKVYSLCGEHIRIVGSAVTGYGEELIKNAFHVDYGVVETIAHYTAAKYFRPDVDFILDIGGQDIKCFKIRGGVIDDIMLNEACSSGCGSFIETYAKSMNCTAAEFAQKGLFAKSPVNLGSRCTVFMNSSVKQAQKEGASVGDISAGLSVSVVKNAVYKVIRAASAAELGENIVVQGGTFHSDAVLRAFEIELGHKVIRPDIAGLMGAYGAALYAERSKRSALITKWELESFVHTSKSAVCNGCENHCHLTINTFGDGAKFVSGNQCEKGAGGKKAASGSPNLYAFKREYINSLKSGSPILGKIGLPLALGMFEFYPLWHAFFTSLGFEVVCSGFSTRRIYEKGQFSIPSDTICYPAKLMHGHIDELLERGVDAIFYPSMTYNIDEKTAGKHFNCPVVAYYSEVLQGNMDELEKTNFLFPYININKRRVLVEELYNSISPVFPSVTKKQIKIAVKDGINAYKNYSDAVVKKGREALSFARESGQRIMILAGRPYHIDDEICHNIDKLAVSLGFTVVSEDSICRLAPNLPVRVLNQWTYHARLYRAARYAAANDDVELVQLVSFGCGVDAITTDEVRSILEAEGKIYTQIKIDEITNLGAIKIRLRSLIGAIEERDRLNES